MKIGGTMKRRYRTLLAITGLAAISSIALADEEWGHSASDTNWTGASGLTNASSKTRKLDSDSWRLGFHAIYYREQSDTPYKLRFETSYLNASNKRTEGGNKEMKSREAKAVGTYNSEYVSVGAGNFIVALQVCTTEKGDTAKDEIKGLRIWGADLQTDGTLTTNSTAHEFKLANCKKWHSKVSCDSNHVATGFRGYYSDYGFSGLAMLCSKIVSTNSRTERRRND